MSTTTPPIRARAPQAAGATSTIDAPHIRMQVGQEMARLQWENQATAAILDLVGQVSACDDLSSASFALVSGLQKCLGAERVALAINKPGAKGGRLMAVSGMAEFDRHSPLALALEAALNEAAWSDRPCIWPSAAGCDDTAPLAAHRQLCQSAGVAGVLGFRLKTAGGATVGAWLMLAGTELVQQPEMTRFALASSEALAAALDLVRRAGKATWLRPVRAVFASRRVGRILVAAAVVAGLVLAMPWPYKIACEAELQPVTRRFVQAPFAGIFEKSLVKPGDIVHRDQVLAKLDGRELRLEAASLDADATRAARSREANMAAGKIAAAQMDKLEMERLGLKRRLLAQRAEQLEVKSPLDGIVIAGDLEKSQGAPLTVGQSLYEIAPLDRMVVEVAIPAEDISHAIVDCAVTISLDAYPGQALTGRLLRVQPRSEVRDSDNVFIGEVEINNADGQLRPGMKGRAKLVGATHSVAWIVLHKPVSRVLAWIGW